MTILFKSNNSLEIFAILFVILTLVKSDSVTINGNEATYDVNSKYPFSQLTFESSGKQNYIVSLDGNNNERILLVQSSKGKANIYLTEKHFKNEKCKLYINPLNQADSFSININSAFGTSINLNKGEPYSYYVTEETETMTFSISSDSPTLNIWARGQLSITTNLSPNNKINKNGNYYIVKDLNEKATFTVTGTK